MGSTNISENTGGQRQQYAKQILIDPMNKRPGDDDPQGCGNSGCQKGKQERLFFIESGLQQQHVNDDPLRKLVQHHADGGQGPGENADAERYRIDDAINEGMKADAQHRDQAQRIFGLCGFVTNVCCHEPVEDVNKQIPRQQVHRRQRIHGNRFWNQVQKRDGNQGARRETGEVGGVFASPVFEFPDHQNPGCRDRRGQKAGQKRDHKLAVHGVIYR